MAIKVPGGADRKGTPKNIFPKGTYLFEVQKVTVKDLEDENEGYMKGQSVNIRLTVEDVAQPALERLIGASFFHNIFIMDPENPNYDTPLQGDTNDRTFGDIGADQFADFCIAAGVDMDDEVNEDDLVGTTLWGYVTVGKDKKTEEQTNNVRRWAPERADSEDEPEEAPAPKKKPTAKKKS